MNKRDLPFDYSMYKPDKPPMVLATKFYHVICPGWTNLAGEEQKCGTEIHTKAPNQKRCAGCEKKHLYCKTKRRKLRKRAQK